MENLKATSLKIKFALDKLAEESPHLNCAKCKKQRRFEVKTIEINEKGEVEISPRYVDLDWIDFYVIMPSRYGVICPNCALALKE